MASIVKKQRKQGVTYYIVYRVKGKSKQHWLRCDSKRDAHAKISDVEEAAAAGRAYNADVFNPNLSASATGSMTVAEMIEGYIKAYGLKSWQSSTLSTNRALANNYIMPLIGSYKLSEVTPRFLQSFIDALPSFDAVNPHPASSSTKKISERTCIDIFKILRPAFNMAVVWGEIPTSPALAVVLPTIPECDRDQWTENEYLHALSLCDNDLLHLSMCLVFACSLRSGELVGLTWDRVNITKSNISKNSSSIYVDKTIQRIKKSSLEDTKMRDIILVFPQEKMNGTTVRVLKKPKTKKSIRKVFLPQSVAELLLLHKSRQDEQKAFLGTGYNDYNLVIAQPDGSPIEVKDLSKRFINFTKKHNLREVDFYSLKHSSITAKLRATHDVKAVQGDTGHATADMIHNVYAQTLDEDRINTAAIMEELVFSKVGASGSKNTAAVADHERLCAPGRLYDPSSAHHAPS